MSIVNIITNYITLRKKGDNYIGVCPFHDDTKPSLIVSDTKNIYKCFACGNGGNEIKFVQNIENISNEKAKSRINEILGFQKYQCDEVLDTKTNIYSLFAKISNLFLTSHQFGKEALNYLYDRCITNDTIKKYQIGFVPNDNLIFELMKKPHNANGQTITDEMLVEVGLIKENWDKSFYNCFNNRIIFPMKNNNVIIGFSGRTFIDSKTKYFNSKNLTKNFLFGYDQINKNIDSIFLTEGIIDCLTLNQLDCNAVCTLGVSYNKEQLNSLKTFHNLKNINIFLDNDIAGYQATFQMYDDLKSCFPNITINCYDTLNIKYKDINEMYINNKQELVNCLIKPIDIDSYRINYLCKFLNEKDDIKKSEIVKKITKKRLNDLDLIKIKENNLSHLFSSFKNSSIIETLKINQNLIADELKKILNKEFGISFEQKK